MSDNPLLDKMLDLPEFEITDLKHNEHDISIYVHAKGKPSVCPSCGVVSPHLRVQQHRQQVVRDISIQHKRVGLFIDRVKYKCMECGSTFIEPLQSVPERARMTARFRSLIAERSKTSNFIDLERELDISNVTIRQIFLEEMDNLPKPSEILAPRILGIDEIHIQRQGKHRKQAWAVLCNGEEHTVIDFLENRNKETIIARLRAMPELHRTEVVTMDMWQPYRDAVREACGCDVVVDKFHVVKMANEALDRLRKDLRADMTERMKKDLKNNRYLLLQREAIVRKYSNADELDKWLERFPILKTAHALKEQLFAVYDCKGKKEAVAMYNDWKASIPSELPHFSEIGDTIDRWHREIFNYFDYRITNAYVEGINSTIRAIEKQGRGYDFAVLRAKVIYCINHKVDIPKYGDHIMYNAPPEFYERLFDLGVPLDDVLELLCRETANPPPLT